MSIRAGASTRDEVLDSIRIEGKGLVVDVGGGHRPFPAANLVLEKYPFEEVHRSAVHGLVHSAPVVIADAASLPIPPGGAELIFASHMIEHLPDPIAFLEEVKRCATRTYIEVPTLRRELIFAWSNHEWYVDIEGAHITFYRNDIPQLFGDLFHRGYDFLADAWHMQRHKELNQWYLGPTKDLTWAIAEESAFELAVSRASHGADKVFEAPIDPVQYSIRQVGVLAAERLLPDRALQALLKVVRRKRTGEVQHLTPPIVSQLMCLKCREASLTLREDEIECTTCGGRYVKRQGLFDFDVMAAA